MSAVVVPSLLTVGWLLSEKYSLEMSSPVMGGLMVLGGLVWYLSEEYEEYKWSLGIAVLLSYLSIFFNGRITQPTLFLFTLIAWVVYGLLDRHHNEYTSDEKLRRAFGISLIILSVIFLLPRQRIKGYPFDLGVAFISAGWFLAV